jgi:hypothetical protein
MKRAMLDTKEDEDDEVDMIDLKGFYKVFKICADHYYKIKVFNFLFRNICNDDYFK